MPIFIYVLLNSAPQIIVQWIEIWRVRRPNVGGDLVVQIISYPFLLQQDFWVCLKVFWIGLSDFLFDFLEID